MLELYIVSQLNGNPTFINVQMTSIIAGKYYIWNSSLLTHMSLSHMRRWGPLHTRDRTLVTIAFYCPSLVGKAETFQVHFTREDEGWKGPKKLIMAGKLEKRKERKITPVHDTNMNVSPLSKCLTRRAMLSHRIYVSLKVGTNSHTTNYG